MTAHASIRLAPGAQARVPCAATARDAMHSPVRSVLVLKADCSAAEVIGREVRACWPEANVTEAQTLAAAQERLAAGDIDWLVAGLNFDDGDAHELIRDVCRLNRTRVVVHTGNCTPRALDWLMSWPVGGIFDSRGESAGRLRGALQMAAVGKPYLSPNVRWMRARRQQSGLDVLQKLSAKEQLALALVTSAHAPKEIATDLELTAEGFRNVVRHLHTKLGVHDMAQLVGEATRLGCVRPALRGLAPVGLPLLREAWQASRGKFRSTAARAGSGPTPSIFFL